MIDTGTVTDRKAIVCRALFLSASTNIAARACGCLLASYRCEVETQSSIRRSCPRGTIQDLNQPLTRITRRFFFADCWVFAFAINLLLSVTVLVQPVRADQASDAKTSAAAAAESWLTIVDNGHHDTSWENRALVVKRRDTSEEWQNMSKQVRSPLGKCLRRKLVSSSYHSEPPEKGGEYVILRYEGSFENLKTAFEQVTFIKDPDGTWKAPGYMIQPGRNSQGTN